MSRVCHVIIGKSNNTAKAFENLAVVRKHPKYAHQPSQAEARLVARIAAQAVDYDRHDLSRDMDPIYDSKSTAKSSNGEAWAKRHETLNICFAPYHVVSAQLAPTGNTVVRSTFLRMTERYFSSVHSSELVHPLSGLPGDWIGVGADVPIAATDAGFASLTREDADQIMRTVFDSIAAHRAPHADSTARDTAALASAAAAEADLAVSLVEGPQAVKWLSGIPGRAIKALRTLRGMRRNPLLWKAVKDGLRKDNPKQRRETLQTFGGVSAEFLSGNPTQRRETLRKLSRNSARFSKGSSTQLSDGVSRLVKSVDKVQNWIRTDAKTDAASLWLEYNYGVRPLIMEVDAWLKALRLETWRFQNHRAADEVDVKGSFTHKSFTVEYEGTITFRTLIRQIARTNERRFGFNLPLAAWEIIPYSFVIDWFINVGQLLQTLSDKPVFKRKAQRSEQVDVSIRVRYTNPLQNNSTPKPLCELFMNGTSYSSLRWSVLSYLDSDDTLYVGQVRSYRREVADRILPGLAWNPRLGWRRQISALALSLQQLFKKAK